MANGFWHVVWEQEASIDGGAMAYPRIEETSIWWWVLPERAMFKKCAQSLESGCALPRVVCMGDEAKTVGSSVLN